MSHNAGIGIRILGLIVLGNILPIGNVQAGWFGLTEDHPYKNTSPYRTAFRTANVNTCVKVSSRDISENIILAYCVCFADEIANVITQKELDYSRKNGVPPLSVKVKTDSVKSACAKKIKLPH